MNWKYVILPLVLIMFLVTGCSYEPPDNTISIKNMEEGEGDCDVALISSYKLNKEDAYLYNNYCPQNYRLEVWINEAGFFDKADKYFIKAINNLMNVIWQLYAQWAYMVIAFLSWAFNLEVITALSGTYKRVIGIIKDSLLLELILLLSALAIGWAVYYWAVGKKSKMWQTLFNIIVIQALILLLFSDSIFGLPKILENTTNISATISNSILKGFTNCMSGNCSAEKDNDNSTDAPDNVSRAVDDTKDVLFQTLILQPYQIINFGSIEKANDEELEEVLGKAPWEAIVSATDEEQREQIIQSGYNPAEGENSPFYRMTKEGYTDRASSLLLLGTISAVICFSFITICSMVIVWQFIAIGRGIIGLFFLVISLWPEYGLKEAVAWFWSMIQALFMKVLYTIFIAALISLLTVLQEEDLSLGLKLILILGLLYGFWTAFKELRAKVELLPFDNDVYLAGFKETHLATKVKNWGVGAVKGGFKFGARYSARGMATVAFRNSDFFTSGIRGTLKDRLASKLARPFSLRAANSIQLGSAPIFPSDQSTEQSAVPLIDQYIVRARATDINLSNEAKKLVKEMEGDIFDASKLREKEGEIQYKLNKLEEIKNRVLDPEKNNIVDPQKLEEFNRNYEKYKSIFEKQLNAIEELDHFRSKSITEQFNIEGMHENNKYLGFDTDDELVKMVLDHHRIGKNFRRAEEEYREKLGELPVIIDGQIPVDLALVINEKMGMNPDELNRKFAEAFGPEMKDLEREKKLQLENEFSQEKERIAKETAEELKRISNQLAGLDGRITLSKKQIARKRGELLREKDQVRRDAQKKVEDIKAEYKSKLEEYKQERDEMSIADRIKMIREHNS